MTGVVGQIKWAYYVAAAINGYTVTRNGRGADATWALTGTVVMADSFKMSQRPLRFVAPHDKGEWVWPITTLDVQNGQLTAQLGPPIE
jgi:hypothetical protein